LYFFPLPQGQGSLRPTLGPVRTGFAFETASLACETMSLAFLLVSAAAAAPPLEAVVVLPPPNVLTD
jgi:hypothetical protein